MKTYVKIELNGELIDEKFDTIDDAVMYAERHGENADTDVLEIDVYDIEDNLLEWQTSERNYNSGDFVYNTWGIFGYTVNEVGKVTDNENLVMLINSEAEARERAENIKDKFSRFDRVCIESYSQTISENIGDVDKCYIIYSEIGDEIE